jgi:hypothetical protein
VLQVIEKCQGQIEKLDYLAEFIQQSLRVNMAFATKASSYYRWMPLGQETGVFGALEHVAREAAAWSVFSSGPTLRVR